MSFNTKLSYKHLVLTKKPQTWLLKFTVALNTIYKRTNDLMFHSELNWNVTNGLMDAETLIREPDR